MRTYLIMQNPGHSRVYYEQSAKLALAELKIACNRFSNACQDIESITIAGISYLSFKTEKQLSEDEKRILSRLSFIFALFELIEERKQTLLVPITIADEWLVNPKITQLLKYSGKTNALFTTMMVNIGLLSSGFSYDQNTQLLDPVAGKGTTLFAGTVYGFDVAGIEIDKKSVHEACIFFKKFLETEKYKHRLTKAKVPRKEDSDSSDIQEFRYASTRDEFKNGETRRKLKFVRGDTRNASKYFKKNSFHVIVGDLPYGISHGNIPNKKKSTPSRNPLGLLSDCLPQWHRVLKKNGTLVLSWNKFVLSKSELTSAITSNGFRVFSEPPYDDFEHRVDVSIKRDLVVAKK